MLAASSGYSLLSATTAFNDLRYDFLNNFSCIKFCCYNCFFIYTNRNRRFTADISARYYYIIVEVIFKIEAKFFQSIRVTYFNYITDESYFINDLIFLQQFIANPY